MDISLYFHIPFCIKKCPYCHFYSIPFRAELVSLFQRSIAMEWHRQLPWLLDQNIVSIYFGGGTPSLLAAGGIAFLLDMIFQSQLSISPNCEITLEANPDRVDFLFLSEIRKLGINRLSLGVQSFDDSSLQNIQRTHTAKKALLAIEDAHQSGFSNISIDLMFDLPHQTIDSWMTTIHRLESLPIQHCSIYNLTIEPNTAFFRQKKHLETIMPDSKSSLCLLTNAIDELKNLGFKRYEISAFAKPGMESVHNSGYWTARPFLGFGPSAFSYWEGRRFQNIAHLQRYAKALEENASWIDFEEKLAYPANVKELLAIGLRRMDGVPDDKSFPKDTIGELHQLKDEGFLQYLHQHWRLTDRGALFYDTIAERLIDG